MKRFDYKLVLKLAGLLLLIFLLYHFAVAQSNGTAPASAINWCDKATNDLDVTVDSYHVHAYRKTYQHAVSGLAKADKCDDDALRLQLRGILLGEKALSEHYLAGHEVDAEVDLNQAVTLLTQCESDPKLYATQAGAQCETVAEGLEKEKTAWDMQEMLPSSAP